MTTATDILRVSGTSMEQKPGMMLGTMLAIMLGLIGLFFVYMGIAQKGSPRGSTFFVVGIVFFALAFICNVGARAIIK